MGAKVVLSSETRSGRSRPIPVPSLGWYLLGWAGWVFLLAGAADVGLGLLPFHPGNPEWEFGTITQSLQSLPLPFMGCALIMAAGVARGRLWWTRVGVSILVLVALAVVGSGVIYALNVPLALRSVRQPEVLYGLKKAIVRTAIQVALYSVSAAVMAWLGAKAMRAVPSTSTPAE